MIITVAGGKYAASRMLLGFSAAAGGTDTHCVGTKCSSSRKMFWERDLVLTCGKLFTQQAERLKL